jgi:hypothetical protein
MPWSRGAGHFAPAASGGSLFSPAGPVGWAGAGVDAALHLVGSTTHAENCPATGSLPATDAARPAIGQGHPGPLPGTATKNADWLQSRSRVPSSES